MPDDRSIALITGASSGIGAALAERLARAGGDLIVVARRHERLQALAERLHDETGAAVDVLVADLTDAHDLHRVEERVAHEDRLDLLVNNAGFSGYGPFAGIERAVAESLIELHVQAPVLITRAALPGMLARGRGAVVNVASMLALSGPLRVRMSGRATYAAAKAFLLTFTQALAGELEGTGVRAMVCLPGMVDSEFHGPAWSAPPGMTIMSPDEVARAVLAGLESGEVVCAPGLEDGGLFERLAELQQAALASGNSGLLASRYHGA